VGVEGVPDDLANNAVGISHKSFYCAMSGNAGCSSGTAMRGRWSTNGSYTEPGARGNTSGDVTKFARLETGLEIKVPLFMQEGVKVKVYTEIREFAGRA
jgi:hypothetical protein